MRGGWQWWFTQLLVEVVPGWATSSGEGIASSLLGPQEGLGARKGREQKGYLPSAGEPIGAEEAVSRPFGDGSWTSRFHAGVLCEPGDRNGASRLWRHPGSHDVPMAST